MRMTLPQANSPLGSAVQNILTAALSGPSPIEQEQLRLKNDYVRANTDKARGEADKLGRENRFTTSLAGRFSTLNGATSPEAVAALASDAVAAGYDPKNLAEAFRFWAANANRPTAEVDRAMLGAGNTYASTPGGFAVDQENAMKRNAADNARALAQTRYQVDNDAQPAIGPNGQPVIMPRAQAFKTQASPILKDNEVQTAPDGQGGYKLTLNTPGGATVPPNSTATPRNYVTADGKQGVTLDGLTDAATQQRIPAGSQVFTGQVQASGLNGVAPTSAAKTELWRENKNLQQFQNTLKIATDLATNNPTAFGAAGTVRRTWQSALAQGDALAQTLGFQANAVKNLAAQSGVPIDPNMFDPSLPQIDVMMRILPYQAAAAIAQQEGRGLSNVDVKAFQSVVGEGPLASLEDFMARKNLLEQMVQQRLGVNARMQGDSNANVPPVVTAPPAQPQTGPAAPPKIYDAPKPRIRIDGQGNIIQ